MNYFFNILPGFFKIIQVIPKRFFRLISRNSSNNQPVVFRKYTSGNTSQSFSFPEIGYFFGNAYFTIKRKEDTESTRKGYSRTYANSFIIYRFFCNLDKYILSFSQFMNNRLTILIPVLFRKR